MPNRREVIVQGAIGAAIIGTNLTGVEALAQAQPPRRRSLRGLAWNDPIVATYRDAVGIMKQRPAGDKLNWIQLANFHGDLQNYKYCPHGDWYFLPWHRAFTAMYERIVRSLTNNPGFAMPYWDWTADPKMPQVFLDPKTPDGKTNWLAVQDAQYQRTWPADRPMPASIVGPTVLNQIMNAQGFETFGTSRNPRQNNLDPSWVPAGRGHQGILEATPHNNVHNNIGGYMPTSASPRDPIFFMHHANIDRIWAMWNLKNGNSTDPLWTNMPFTNNYRNPDGSFWSPKVSDLYVPEQLGYTYGLPAPAAGGGTRKMLLSRKLSGLFAGGGAALTSAAGVRTVAVGNTQAATASNPLSVSIQVPPAALDAARRGVPKGLLALDSEAAGTRVLAFLRDVVITNAQNTMFRVFVDGDDVSAATPTTHPSYVGTFGVLQHSTHHGELPSFVLDLTDAIRRRGPSPQAGTTGTIRLHLLPVHNGGAGGEVGTATPQRIEVSFIAN